MDHSCFLKQTGTSKQHVLIPTTSNFGLWKYPVWYTTNAGLAIFELPAHLQKAQSFWGTCQPVIFCHENLLISHAATMKTMMNFWTISSIAKKKAHIYFQGHFRLDYTHKTACLRLATIDHVPCLDRVRDCWGREIKSLGWWWHNYDHQSLPICKSFPDFN